MEKVYALKAGKKKRDHYKGISLKSILSEIRGQNDNYSPGIKREDLDAPNSVKGTTIKSAKTGFDEIDFFAFYDKQHLKRKPHEIYTTVKKKLHDFHNSEGPLPMKEITKQWAKEWLSFLRETMSENSVTLYYNHIRTILQEAVEDEIIPFNALWLIAKKDRPKLRRADADSLTFEEIQILTRVERPRIPREGQLMFLFSCFTGLRVSDCVSLKWNQIYSVDDNGQKKYRLRVKQIKTEARVNKPLSDSALTILEQRRIDAEDYSVKSAYIFPSYCPQRMSISAARSRIGTQLKRWGKQADLDHRMHFHLARHTYATMLLEQGNDITVVQQLLGHKDIRATMIYAHVSTGIKERAVSTLPKINKSMIEKRIETSKPQKKTKKRSKKS